MTTDQLTAFQRILGEQPVQQVALVSNGPWYGFNGVQALVLTEHALYRVQAGYALRAGRILDRYSLDEVSDVRWLPRRKGRSGRLTLKTSGQQRSFVSKWSEASDMATTLAPL